MNLLFISGSCSWHVARIHWQRGKSLQVFSNAG